MVNVVNFEAGTLAVFLVENVEILRNSVICPEGHSWSRISSRTKILILVYLAPKCQTASSYVTLGVCPFTSLGWVPVS